MSGITAGITYSRVGDYYLPDITLNEPPPELIEPLGRYGHLRQRFLRDHRTITYNTLLLSEQLFPHLRTVDKTATERLEAIVSDILAVSPPPDKAADGFVWASHIGEVRRIAEQMMLGEVVFA